MDPTHSHSEFTLYAWNSYRRHLLVTNFGCYAKLKVREKEVEILDESWLWKKINLDHFKAQQKF